MGRIYFEFPDGELPERAVFAVEGTFATTVAAGVFVGPSLDGRFAAPAAAGAWDVEEIEGMFETPRAEGEFD